MNMEDYYGDHFQDHGLRGKYPTVVRRAVGLGWWMYSALDFWRCWMIYWNALHSGGSWNEPSTEHDICKSCGKEITRRDSVEVHFQQIFSLRSMVWCSDWPRSSSERVQRVTRGSRGEKVNLNPRYVRQVIRYSSSWSKIGWFQTKHAQHLFSWSLNKLSVWPSVWPTTLESCRLLKKAQFPVINGHVRNRFIGGTYHI